jgi:lysophospholipase L1-like esterase
MGPADIEDVGDVEDIDAGGAADVGSAVVAGSTTNDAAQAAAPPTPPRHRVSTVLWVGDSVAADLAPALTAAFGAAGVGWIDGAGDGLRLTPGGGVDPVSVYTDLFAEHTFDTVVVQLSYWDNPADLDQLRRSLGWFRDQVRARDADLVVVTPPPVRADLVDPGLARQIEVARELVADGDGRVHLVDSVGAWGATMSVDIDMDGAPDRKPDGVHVCPQGAARFASWLASELSTRFDGITAQPVGAWGSGGWSFSERYDTPTGACAAVN